MSDSDTSPPSSPRGPQDGSEEPSLAEDSDYLHNLAWTLEHNNSSFLDQITTYWAEYDSLVLHAFVKRVREQATRRIDTLTNHSKNLKQRWAKPVSEKLEQTLKLKELQKMMKDTPFIRTKDKISFMLGVVLLLLSQYCLLLFPESFHILYTLCLIPLLTLRFMLYHKAKWHYFMLDFCYYCQIVTICSLYIFPSNAPLFKLTFALCNGPLLMAVVAWKNTLVFHDLDKITSLFIHIYPPLVLFCERWYSRRTALYEAGQDSLTLWQGVIAPIAFEVLWQVFYTLKTELLDSDKINQDKDMLTSSKWLSEIKPHPIYKMLLARGVKLSPRILLPLVQLLYTTLTLIPAWIAFYFYWANVVYLGFVFLAAGWYGASFYFDIFSENYSKRLQKSIKEESSKLGASIDNKYHPTSWMSVLSFIAYFALFMSIFLMLLKIFCS